MYRYDRVDSPTMSRDGADVPPTPALSSTAHSPRSSSLPSTNTSTVDDPVHSATSLAQKANSALTGGVGVEESTS